MQLPAGTSLAELLVHRSTLAERPGGNRSAPLPGALAIAQRLAAILAAGIAGGDPAGADRPGRRARRGAARRVTA